MNNIPVYMCKDCLKNKQTKRKIFYTLNKPNPDDYKNKCLTCGGSNVTKINLSNDETERLINFVLDLDIILKMNELKVKDFNKFISEFHRFEEIQRKKDRDRQEVEKRLAQNPTAYSTPKPKYVPKCPTCGSPDIKKINGLKKWVGIGAFGLASSDLGKTMQCNNCGYKW